MSAAPKEEDDGLNKFWNWIRDETTGERVLRLEGPIDEDSFWGDEITPQAFREELEADTGDITVWLNSPGGSVFAAADIYTMLCDYPGKVTVKIESLAASAASVVAMAGDSVLMSPVSLLMIHDPMTIAMGNTKDMEKAISTLNEVKESIINAYVRKTGLSRNKVSKLMSDETWINAKKAVELGFADKIMFDKDTPPKGEDTNEAKTEDRLYSTRGMRQAILNRLCAAPKVTDEAQEDPPTVDEPEDGVASNPTSDSTVPIDEETELPTADHDTTEGAETPEHEGREMAAELPPADEAPETKMSPVTVEMEDTPAACDIRIGLDGRTPDGAMPYEILRVQLEFLK